jgi:hypothetical protein
METQAVTIDDLMQQKKETERLIAVYRNADEVIVGTEGQIYSRRGLVNRTHHYGGRDRRRDRQYPRASACGDASGARITRRRRPHWRPMTNPRQADGLSPAAILHCSGTLKMCALHQPSEPAYPPITNLSLCASCSRR